MKKTKKGKVYLVGAGPGDFGLLTLRAAELLRTANVVVHDRLVNPEIISLASTTEKIYVGKNMHARSRADLYVPQAKINALLVRLAKQGKTVVRLKGGDPFIFGRGAEEASFLRKSGIAFEVVPGITAGIAAPAYAGIPMTDRRKASEVTFVTAHEDLDKKEAAVKWKHIAQLDGTLVLYMAIKNLKKITERLIDDGKSPNTPVSIIASATCSNQKIVDGKLSTIATKARKAKIISPGIVVIGDVTRLRKELSWFNPKSKFKPLEGTKILVTRARAQASSLKQSLQAEGGEVIEFPTIKIAPPKSWGKVDDALKNLKRYDWLLLTSVNGVQSIFSRLRKLKLDARALANVKIACIGEATSQELLENGIRADLVPDKFTTDGLLDALTKKRAIKGAHFLLARTDIAPRYLNDELKKRGGKITQVVAYRTISTIGPKQKKQLGRWLDTGVDYVTFTSSSTVDHFFKALPKSKRDKMSSRLISIGPVTSKQLAGHGYRAHREAKQHTIPGIVEAICHDRT